MILNFKEYHNLKLYKWDILIFDSLAQENMQPCVVHFKKPVVFKYILKHEFQSPRKKHTRRPGVIMHTFDSSSTQETEAGRAL